MKSPTNTNWDPDLMSWNYRVVKHVGPGDRVYYRVHEVYYHGEQIETVAEDASSPSGATIEELTEDFTAMRAAFDQPILNYSDL